METDLARPPGAPQLKRDARREAILDVAQEVFLQEGFSAASMSSIAARLGGSKGTLYNYFKSKDELFESYVRRHCAWQSEAMFSLFPEEADIRGALRAIGVRYLKIVLSDFNLLNLRLIVAQSERSPQIGRAFYESGPLNGAARLAEFLSQATARGELCPCDPMVAAHQLIGLCQNRLMKARMCNAVPEPGDTEIRLEVDQSVETFMAAFGPQH